MISLNWFTLSFGIENETIEILILNSPVILCNFHQLIILLYGYNVNHYFTGL